MIDENTLSALLSKDVRLALIEPHIYSVCQNDENSNPFTRVARFYDVVICNSLYNRLVWGYSVTTYAPFMQDALTSSPNGWILDVGCGSLAFTARTYVHYSRRPIIFLDNSLTLLRIAKSRLTKLNNVVPTNVVFLYGDALALPFNHQCIDTVISLNLLHVLHDAEKALLELQKVLAEKGGMFFTTLVENSRLADNYLRWVLTKTCGVAPRTIQQLQEIFNGLGLPIVYDIRGNMAFISCR